MNRIIIILFTLSLTSFCAVFHSYGQGDEVNTIKGIVIDDKNMPISGSLCLFKENDHIGVVTDSTGYFVLDFPGVLSYDTMVISRLGHKTLKLPLSNMGYRKDTIYLAMDRQAIMLEGVEVTAKSDYLKDLYLQALARKSKNYPNKVFQANGFYRRVFTEDGQAVELSEIAFVLQDNSLGRSYQGVILETEAFRQSKYWGGLDSTTIMSPRNEMNGKHHNNPKGVNPALYSYLLNPLVTRGKNLFSVHYARVNRFIDETNFTLMGISIADGDSIYQISIQPPNAHHFARSYLKINKKDKAIVEYNFSSIEDNKINHQRLMKWKKIQGRYYPMSIKWIQRIYPKDKLVGDEFEITITWFDKVKTKGFKKLRLSNMESSFHINDLREWTYDSNFWSNYKSLGEHPLPQAVREALAKHEPVDEQFHQERKAQPTQ